MSNRYTSIMSIIVTAGLCATPAIGEEVVGCDEVDWKQEVLLQFDGIEEACQDVVIRDGARYARFEVIFHRARANGDVHFSMRLRDGTRVERAFPAPKDLFVSSPTGNSEWSMRELERGDVLDVYIPLSFVVAAAPTH
ncbi:MAG: hypothetical protein ACN4GT_14730 [Gammaproteobacteria bacterium]